MNEISAYDLVKKSELEKYFKIGEFNRRMSGNPRALMNLSNKVFNLRDEFPSAKEFLEIYRSGQILSSDDIGYLSFLVKNDLIRKRSQIQTFTNQLYDLMLRKMGENRQ